MIKGKYCITGNVVELALDGTTQEGTVGSEVPTQPPTAVDVGTALNDKEAVVDSNDLTQSPVWGNTEATSNTPRLAAEDGFTRRGFEPVPRLGDTPEPAPVSWLAHHLLEAGEVNSIAGEPGVGKSVFAAALAVAIAAGAPFLDRTTQQGVVFYLNFDASGGPLRRHMQRFAHTLGSELKDLPIYLLQSPEGKARPEGGLLNDDYRAYLADQIDYYKPKLLIVDTVETAYPDLNGNQSKSIHKMHKVLRELREKSLGMTVVLLDHTPKAKTNQKSASGSQQKSARVRAAYTLTAEGFSESGTSRIRVNVQKVNNAPPQRDFIVEYEGTLTSARLIVHKLPGLEFAPKARQTFELALELIRQAGNEGIARAILIKRIVEEISASISTVESVINDRVRSHQNVLELQLKGRGNPKGYRWRDTPGNSRSGGADENVSKRGTVQPGLALVEMKKWEKTEPTENYSGPSPFSDD